MGYKRWILIGITILIVGALTFAVETWAKDFKDLFFYMNDWTSWIFVGLFVAALTGIFKWILDTEVAITRPERRRRK